MHRKATAPPCRLFMLLFASVRNAGTISPAMPILTPVNVSVLAIPYPDVNGRSVFVLFDSVAGIGHEEVSSMAGLYASC